mmetsp:Transcript_8671/g.24361  ORF Transcript_8671/g.24361 Transcript_8671/m.24361 type:complete len:93 (-) Transcript_8671:462-740(-)
MSRYERSIVAEHMQTGVGGGSSSIGSQDAKASIAGVSTCTVSSGSSAGSASGAYSRNYRPSSSASPSTAAASDEYLHVASVTATPSHLTSGP